MSTPVSPTDFKLPSRSATVTSTLTRRTSASDDEAIPDTDSSEVRPDHLEAGRYDHPAKISLKITRGTWIDKEANCRSLIDHHSPDRTSTGMEAHVRNPRGLHLHARQSRQVPVQGP